MHGWGVNNTKEIEGQGKTARNVKKGKAIIFAAVPVSQLMHKNQGEN